MVFLCISDDRCFFHIIDQYSIRSHILLSTDQAYSLMTKKKNHFIDGKVSGVLLSQFQNLKDFTDTNLTGIVLLLFQMEDSLHATLLNSRACSWINKCAAIFSGSQTSAMAILQTRMNHMNLCDRPHSRSLCTIPPTNEETI